MDGPQQRRQNSSARKSRRRGKRCGLPESSRTEQPSSGGRTMPYATIRGVALNYEILGDRGPSMMLSPGGRNGYATIKPFAQKMANKGFRVLVHDRRNTGSSDVAFDASKSEYEVWADDLELLLRHLKMAPAIIGGSSSGARLALNFVRMYPQSVTALMLWRVTGGGFAVKRLAERYYDQYIRLAGERGMA